MQNEKNEGVNDEQRRGCAKTKKTETRQANEQATKKLAEKQTNLTQTEQQLNKENTLRSYTVLDHYQHLCTRPYVKTETNLRIQHSIFNKHMTPYI